METGSIVIRGPLISDLNQIVHINRVSLPENYPVGYFIELIRNWQNYSSVAIVDGLVVGYLIMRLEHEKSFRWRVGSYDKAHLISIAVLPEYRRMGLGEKMLIDSLSKLKKLGGIKSVILEVRVSNTPAILLYEKHGFIKSDRMKYYYADGEDAYLMTLYL